MLIDVVPFVAFSKLSQIIGVAMCCVFYLVPGFSL